MTGTILRCVAPIGSSIISLNASEIQKTDLLTTATESARNLGRVSKPSQQSINARD